MGGYAWWYVEVHDVVEGRFGLTLIFFAGSVFSPDYAARRRAGEAVCGLDVPAVNFALYERTRGPYPTAQRAWVMNEYRRDALQLDGDGIRIGHSSMRFAADGSLVIELDEDTTRFFGRPGPRLRGRITVAAAPPGPGPLALGKSSRGEAHHWQPLAARAAATVDLTLAGRYVHYQGLAYCDHNYGAGRLEDTFARWGWAHGFQGGVGAEVSPAAKTGGGEGAVIVYHTTDREGQSRQICVHYANEHDPPAVIRTELTPPAEPLGRDLLWLRAPRTWVAGPYTCRRVVGGTLEDTPFYARFAVIISKTPESPGDDASGFAGVGEYLDLGRFQRRSLQHLLRYKTRLVGGEPGP